jgi:hypothetical protein
MMKLEVVVPTSLSEITLEQYQSFIRLQGDDEFLAKKAVEIFCGVSFQDLPLVRFKDIYNIVQHIHTMLQEKPSLTPTFKIGDTKYGFIPNLEDITYGEFVDLDQFLADPKQLHQAMVVDLDQFLADPKQLHQAMAVLYRPIVEKVGSRYNIEPYEVSEAAADTMKQAPMDIVTGAVVFFYRLGKELLTYMQTSLGEGQKRMSTLPKHNSENDGDGTQHSIALLKAMLDDLTKYQDSPFTNVLHSSPLKRASRRQKTTYSKAK